MPSLYETTAIVGDVSSSNFTTLYNSSGLSAPNTGGGAVGGNLNVAGNLTVQGSSLLQGAVTLGSTLSLPSYTFPNTDGTTYQVLTTDGSGNLTWSSVQTLPGANYTISASTATGGADLDLVSGVTTDSVKFAGGTNITVTRTDANTITISSSADDIPDGTAQGQVLYWDGTAWTADSTITSLVTTSRFTTELKNSSKSFSGSAVFRRNYGSSAYVEDDATSVIFQVDSDSQAIVPVGTIGYKYSATNPTFSAIVSTDSFATSTEIAKINLTNIEFNGTNLYLNKNHTGAPSSNAAIIVERGTSTDATLTWNETNDQWELNNQLYITSGNLYVNGEVAGVNQDSTAVDSYIYLKGSTQYLKWNNTSQQFELSNASVVGGNLTVNGVYSQTGETMSINSDNTSADSYLYMKGTNKYLAWLNSANRFFLNEDAKIDGLLELQGDQLVINVDNTAVSSQIWAGTSSSLIYDNVGADWTFSDSLNVQGNLDVTGNIDASSIVIDGLAGMNTNTTTTTSTATVSISQTTRNVLKSIVYIVDNVTSAVHTVEALILRNGATAMLTTYGEMYSASALATFTADVSGGFIRLLATPASANNTTIDIVGVGLT